MIATLNGVTAGGGLTLPDFVALAAKTGFKGVDISIEAAQQMTLAQARDLFAQHNVLPTTINLPVEWRGDDATFKLNLKTLSGKAKFAWQLGISRCCTYVLPSPSGDETAAEYAKRSIKRFASIAEILADYEIQLGLEFIGPQHFRPHPNNVWFYDIAGALQVCDAVNEETGVPNTGLLVDSFHWYASGASVMDLAAIPLEHIVHVHINDAPQGVAPADVVDSVRELPGATGQIDLTGFLTAIKNLGYVGPVAVETFSDELKSLPPAEAAKRASQSVQSAFEAAGLDF